MELLARASGQTQRCSWKGTRSRGAAPERRVKGGNKLGGDMNLLNEKLDFLRSTNFKLLRQI